jgi:hypothetical protein
VVMFRVSASAPWADRWCLPLCEIGADSEMQLRDVGNLRMILYFHACDYVSELVRRAWEVKLTRHPDASRSALVLYRSKEK